MYYGCHVIALRGWSHDHDLSWPRIEGGQRQRKEPRKGGQRETTAPNVISLFKMLHWQPGHTECSPIISTQHKILGRGRSGEKGTQEKKNGFDTQAGERREVTSSRPFQWTWPPAVWWIMEPHMGHQGGTRGGTHGNAESQDKGVVLTVK